MGRMLLQGMNGMECMLGRSDNAIGKLNDGVVMFKGEVDVVLE